MKENEGKCSLVRCSCCLFHDFSWWSWCWGGPEKRIWSQIAKMLLKINFWWFGLVRNRNRDIFRNLKIASERQFFNHILFILDSCPCKSLSFSIKPLAISLHFLSFSIDFRLIFWFPFIFVSRTSPFNFQGLEKSKKNG